MSDKMKKKYKTAAVICELDPLHFGHQALFRQAKEAADGLVCLMSGSFVQRGAPAMTDKWARCRMALENGADLVFELPLPWACAGAERFAAGGVALANALGGVELLLFGSEIPDVSLLEKTAAAAISPEFSQRLAALPDTGQTFARRREAVLEELLGPAVLPVLRSPNAILGVEYCKALLRSGSSIRPEVFLRQGAGHDEASEAAGFLSGSRLRKRFRAGGDLRGVAPESTVKLLAALRGAGLAPASADRLETAILCKLRTMEPEDFARLPDLSEGLENRLYQASRKAGSLRELYESVKSKRYTLARVRRLVLYAFLGVPKALPDAPPYLRLLGMGPGGERVLKTLSPALPLAARPADIRKLDSRAQDLFRLEARAGDLWALSCPVPPPCGRDYTEKLVRN